MDQIVDRNLRQRFLPFVWNPDSDIYTKPSDKLTEKSNPQIWSFRPKDKKGAKGRMPRLGIMPDDHFGFTKDISFKQLFTNNTGTGAIMPDLDLSIYSILNNIPAIQIREYTQDTRLDLVFSMVELFVKGVNDGKKVSESLSQMTDEQKYAFKFLVLSDLKNIGKSTLCKKIVEEVKGSITSDVGVGNYKRDSVDSDLLIDFVYMMYYKLLTTTSTNIYVLPYSSDHIFQGNGTNGFEQQNGFSIGNKMGGALGMLADFIAPNVNITTTPIWRGIQGGGSVNVDITLNLFNDTIDHTITNFIFVNTIMPQNLPTQYGVFSQPPSLYDIKIEGGNRLFMCSGKFDCKYKGVMRTPNDLFKFHLAKHINKNCWTEGSKIVSENLIKIPDQYQITMNFSSLLPNTFNNYLFQYALNQNITTSAKNCTQQGILDNEKITGAIESWLDARTTDAQDMGTEINMENTAYRDVFEKHKQSQAEALSSGQITSYRTVFEQDKNNHIEEIQKIQTKYIGMQQSP